jgi:hypothetical protein
MSTIDDFFLAFGPAHAGMNTFVVTDGGKSVFDFRHRTSDMA